MYEPRPKALLAGPDSRLVDGTVAYNTFHVCVCASVFRLSLLCFAVRRSVCVATFIARHKNTFSNDSFAGRPLCGRKKSISKNNIIKTMADRLTQPQPMYEFEFKSKEIEKKN